MTTITPHDEATAKTLRRLALQVFTHNHPSAYRSEREKDLVKSNCGACAITGYKGVVSDGVVTAPNHAGWARVFVQAGVPIPAAYREAFEDARVSENTLFAAGLAQDIATFGVTYAA
jgi:hypothetical protein